MVCKALALFDQLRVSRWSAGVNRSEARAESKLAHQIHREELEPEVDVEWLSSLCKPVHLREELRHDTVYVRLKELQRLSAEAMGDHTPLDGMTFLGPRREQRLSGRREGVVPAGLAEPVCRLAVSYFVDLVRPAPSLRRIRNASQVHPP